MREVHYECSNPQCLDQHVAVIMESLPARPLSYVEIDKLPETTPIVAAEGHETFRSYTGEDKSYQESHTDLIAIIHDDVGRVLRLLPNLGWAIEAEIEVIEGDDPGAVIKTLFDDYESGVL